MNEADIKKCIKNGYAWSSCGEKPEKTPTRDYMRGHLKTFDGLHATKCEAQAAIDARKAAQAALDKAKQPEHKFAEIPSWCPPLPDGYVPLGMGNTFKVALSTCFDGAHTSRGRMTWSLGPAYGFDRDVFYAAPRNSEIAILNYPWLKDEVASHETPSGETQAKEVSTGETQTVLEEAMKCVGGPRRRDYGTPDENFGRIADLWNVHLKGKLSKPVTPGDVAMMMILMKVARQANSPKRDNLVDIAGYAQCASELKEDK